MGDEVPVRTRSRRYGQGVRSETLEFRKSSLMSGTVIGTQESRPFPPSAPCEVVCLFHDSRVPSGPQKDLRLGELFLPVYLHVHPRMCAVDRVGRKEGVWTTSNPSRTTFRVGPDGVVSTPHLLQRNDPPPRRPPSPSSTLPLRNHSLWCRTDGTRPVHPGTGSTWVVVRLTGTSLGPGLCPEYTVDVYHSSTGHSGCRPPRCDAVGVSPDS